MNYVEYQQQFNRLIDVYPEFYKGERPRIIFENLKGFEVKWLEAAVTYYIGYHRDAPLLGEFEEYMHCMSKMFEFEIHSEDINYKFWLIRKARQFDPVTAGGIRANNERVLNDYINNNTLRLIKDDPKIEV